MALQLQGNIAYKIKGGNIKIGIRKIKNSRDKDTYSGTLRISLITSN